MYTYRGRVLRVIDGDTVYIEIDLGFSVYHRQKCRLLGIDAPEMRTPEGIAAKDWLMKSLTEFVTVRTHKDKQDKYGRYLVEILTDQGSLNNLMIQNGHAVPWPAQQSP